jgi:hypothetical protein
MKSIKELLDIHAAPVVFALGLAVLAVNWAYAREVAGLERKIAELEYAALTARTVCIATSKHNLDQE